MSSLYDKKEITEFDKVISGQIYHQADMGVFKMARGNLLCSKLNRTSILRETKTTD